MSAIPFLVGAVVGIISALLTILITPTLQHYFWTRQRQAERQLAVIGEANKLLGEYLFQCQEDYSKALEEQRVVGIDESFFVRFFPALIAIDGDIQALFSAEAVQAYQEIRRFIPIGRPKTTWAAFYLEVAKVRTTALQALYKDIGIPSPPRAEWMRKHAWQPISARVWKQPQQRWREHWWPALQQRGGRGMMRLRESQARMRQRRSDSRRTHGDI